MGGSVVCKKTDRRAAWVQRDGFPEGAPPDAPRAHIGLHGASGDAPSKEIRDSAGATPQAGFPVTAQRIRCVCSIRSLIGRKRAMTIVPTTTARKTIMIGSMTDVSAATELSTSSS
jgi:hypothetical protein